MKHDGNQIDLNDLPIFLAVAEVGSFTKAAQRRGCAKARVSLVIKRLERHLGVTLFTRTTRRVALTQAGKTLYNQCHPLLDQLDSAFDEVGTAKATLDGILRISAPTTYAVTMLAPAVSKFRQCHPGVHIELRGSDRVTDMVAEGIDLAIRCGWLQDSSLRAIKLCGFEQYLLASPSYLERHGTPQSPDELSGHAGVALSVLAAPLTWTFQHGDEERRVQLRNGLTVDSLDLLLAVAIHGAGLAVSPNLAVQDALNTGRLKRLLPEWHLKSGGVYAVYPPGRYLSVGAEAFVEFLRQEL